MFIIGILDAGFARGPVTGCLIAAAEKYEPAGGRYYITETVDKSLSFRYILAYIS
jgi:hypothetical protein